MADETNNSVPPKISPLTPHTPGAPRPITVKIRRPVTTASAPLTPPAAPATPETAEPAAPAAPAAAPAAAAAPAPSAPPHATSRVPLPEGVAPAAPINRPTIRLKPISPAGTPRPAAPAPAAEAPVTPAIPTPQPAPTPGSDPLPEGPKPPSAAQTQASKSKTSRISLDSAIGVAPTGDATASKTIRLKRPSDIGSAPTVVSKPVPKPAAAETTEESGDAGVTQKRTLKIKRPTIETPKAEESEGGDEFANLTPIDMASFGPVEHESKAFTAIAVIFASIAAIVMIGLTLCLAAHAIGPGANPNTIQTIDGPELPWPGRIIR